MQKNNSAVFWAVAFLSAVGLLIARVVYPEATWASIIAALALLGSLGGLVQSNRTALKSRSAAYGLNSAVTVLLVLGIVGVLNFIVSRYPQKLDLTKNKLHTLSDQTVKVVKGLSKTVNAVLYSKVAKREQFRPLLDEYRGLNPKFEVEYVDPDKEPARTRQEGIKKNDTLVLKQSGRDSKVEDPTEEKLTNALIKLSKDKSQTLCSLTGHNEKSFNASDAEGFDSAKKELATQSYEVREVSLLLDAKGLTGCDAIAILGPTKSFLEPELKAIQAYLENGGRAVIGIDLNLKGGETAPELNKLLESWYIRVGSALIVDPSSTMFQMDASVAIMNTWSKDSPITKDLAVNNIGAFPFARPLEIVSGAPAGLNLQWMAKSTPRSWGETDMKEIQTGKVKLDPGVDKPGPLITAISLAGKQKDSKAARDTRLVVFGSSYFGNNNFSRIGVNQDLLINSISWLLEDESMISIRAKEDAGSKVELSQKSGSFIFLLTVVLIPLIVAVGGIVIWVLRRRL